ncbi:ABC transporter ATP-binding protein [Actinopolymorpha alba]|uniref:ABC transporter ATP-binding protein n=1 Tax=Actinopolymorpha alba TaxID=533267 RepID=UPI000373FA80|nr:ABC transporter ATP-binding protein [Actinopolymorpha alba]
MKLELRGLTKRFGSLVANDHIDLTVESGEIHCLLGENGAGKSTLMNVLYGLLQPDEGSVLLDGEPLTCTSPGAAIAAGIGMVHQHFMLVPVFTVAENVMLGRERTRGLGVLDQRAARTLVRELSERYGLAVDPDARVEDIPVGVQQRVEILKALANEAKVLILDEPTAVLTPQEIDELIEVMRALKRNGTSVIFITHKLKEVRAIADRITVIRRGKVVATVAPDTSESELAELMVGRPVQLQVDKRAGTNLGGAKLAVEGLDVVDPQGFLAVDGVSFEVRGGEILGIAGVQGNGQTELVEALMGLTAAASGSVKLGGRELVGAGPREHLEAGIGYIPEDRSHDGYVGTFSVAENLILDLHSRAPFSRNGTLSPAAIRANAAQRVEEFDVRTQSVETEVSALSGGNQQKVVLARELSRPLELLIAAQPTRGLDVGSIEFVHNRIVRERDQGTAVLIVSTELEEIVALSDRIAVMYRGRIVGIVGPDTSWDQLGCMMAGIPPEEAAQQAEENPTVLGALEDAHE